MTPRPTASDLHVHDRFRKASTRDRFVDDRLQLVGGVLMLQLDRVEAAEQARQMVVDRKRLATIRAHHLVNGIGKLESAVFDVNHGAVERQEFSVDVGDFRHGARL